MKKIKIRLIKCIIKNQILYLVQIKKFGFWITIKKPYSPGIYMEFSKKEEAIEHVKFITKNRLNKIIINPMIEWHIY